MIIAHCTVPQTLLVEHDIRSHFESGKSVALAGEMITGAVTLVRIGGNNLRKIWIAEGKLVENLSNPNHCRTQIRINLTSRSQVDELLTNPLGNHLIMIYGHSMDKIKRWWEMYIEE